MPMISCHGYHLNWASDLISKENNCGYCKWSKDKVSSPGTRDICYWLSNSPCSIPRDCEGFRKKVHRNDKDGQIERLSTEVKESRPTAGEGPFYTHFKVWVMLIVEDPTVTMKN